MPVPVPVPAYVAGLPQTAVAQTQYWLWEKGVARCWLLGQGFARDWLLGKGPAQHC